MELQEAVAAADLPPDEFVVPQRGVLVRTGQTIPRELLLGTARLKVREQQSTQAEQASLGD